MREKEKKSARERECVCVCDARVSARVCLCVCVCVCVRERERARARERKSESARARERDRERGVQIKKLLPGREWRKREFLTHCRIKISQRKSDRRGSTSSITSAKRTSQPCLSTSSEIDSAEARSATWTKSLMLVLRMPNSFTQFELYRGLLHSASFNAFRSFLHFFRDLHLSSSSTDRSTSL